MAIPFRIKNAPAIFSSIVATAFKEFIHKLLDIYFDDWTAYGLVKYHIESLRMMLEQCRQFHISLNMKKCIYCAPFGILWGHVVYRDGILMDSTKIAIIFYLHPPTLVK